MEKIQQALERAKQQRQSAARPVTDRQGHADEVQNTVHVNSLLLSKAAFIHPVALAGDRLPMP